MKVKASAGFGPRAELAHERLDAKAAGRVFDETHGGAIDLDSCAIEDEGRIVFDGVALLRGTGGEIEGPPAGGVELLDEPHEHALVLAAHPLHGDQLELRQEVDQHVADAAVGLFGIVEAAEVKRGDAKRRPQRVGRRNGRPVGAKIGRRIAGHEFTSAEPSVLVMRLELIVQAKVDRAGQRDQYQGKKQRFSHGSPRTASPAQRGHPASAPPSSGGRENAGY